MGWFAGDGRHDGHLAPMFGDGQRGHGVTGGSVPPDEVVVGGEVQREDASWTWPTRPAGEVTGWVVCCDWYCHTSFGPASSWIGPVFIRVPSKTQEDLTARRIFAADDDVVYVTALAGGLALVAATPATASPLSDLLRGGRWRRGDRHI